jgi:hypothetical protein
MRGGAAAVASRQEEENLGGMKTQERNGSGKAADPADRTNGLSDVLKPLKARLCCRLLARPDLRKPR